jgi:hypothetical protein
MIENFILEMENCFDSEYCEKCIKYYKNLEASGLGYTSGRKQLNQNLKRHKIDDTATTIHGEETVSLTGTQNLSSLFVEKFWKEVYPLYTDKYSVLDEADSNTIHYIKIQKTKIGQGFHIWHQECATRESSSRILNFQLFLNTVEEGGETEFLYYPKRIKAEQGKMVVYPSHFTHTHRGNAPISNDKYIITGWVEY